MDITVYGDSIFKGVLLENGRYVVNRTWEERLSEQYHLRINNRSRFGCTIGKALAVIRHDCAQKPEDRGIALLEFGGNDCDYHWEEISRSPSEAHACKTPPAAFLKAYREALACLRQHGRTPVIVNLPPIHSQRYLSFLCRNGLSRENILRWLGDVEAISRWQQGYSEMTEALARETDTPLLEVRSGFPARGEALAELLCADGIHPDRRGQRVLYDRLCACLG